MSLLQRLRKHWRAGIATIVAGSMLAGGLTAAFAGDVTGGEAFGGGYGNTGDAAFSWAFKENYGDLNEANVRKVLSDHGVQSFGSGSDRLIREAVNNARNRVSGNHQWRLVGVGWQYGIVDGTNIFTEATWNATIKHDGWVNAFKQVAGNGRKYYYKDQPYTIDTRFSDGGSLMGMVENLVGSNPDSHLEIMVLALNENEPQVSYHVDVSTTAHPGNMYLPNNEPVYDTVHTRVTKGQWPSGNRLNATVWLNYEPGHGASTQPAKVVRKDFTISQQGDTNTPQL